MKNVPHTLDGGVILLEFDPEGTTLLAASLRRQPTPRGGLIVHDLATGKSFPLGLEGMPWAGWVRRGVARVLTSNGRLSIWTIRGDQSSVVEWNDAVRNIAAAAFSPNGEYVAYAVGPGAPNVQLLDVARRRAASLVGHQSTVTAVQFSASGDRLVSASSDRTIRVWDVRTERAVATIPLGAPVRHVAFTPDAKQVVALLDGPTLRVAAVTWRDVAERVSDAITHCLSVPDRMLCLGESPAMAQRAYAACQTRLERDPTWPPSS